MGHMMNGKWVNDDRITADARGAFRARRFAISPLDHGRRQRRDLRQRPVSRRAGALSFIRFVLLPVGAPDDHLPQAQEARKRDLACRSPTSRRAKGGPIPKASMIFSPCDDGIFRLYQVYAAADANYTGKVTVPTLWDRERRTIVNNESSEIIRMFNSAFGAHTDVSYDFYPEELRGGDRPHQRVVYSHFNNGVYRAGFARSQEAYEEAARKIFVCLDMMEKLLGERRYLAGRSNHRSRLARFSDLAALRFSLLQPLQVQPAPRSGLSESGELSARALSVAGNQRDVGSCRKSRRVTTASSTSIRRASCRSGRFSTIWNCRTIAAACRAAVA